MSKTHRIQMLLDDQAYQRLCKAAAHTGWSHSAFFRLGLAVILPMLEAGRDVCKDGCIAQRVIDILEATTALQRDLQGRTLKRRPGRPASPAKVGTILPGVLKRIASGKPTQPEQVTSTARKRSTPSTRGMIKPKRRPAP